MRKRKKKETIDPFLGIFSIHIRSRNKISNLENVVSGINSACPPPDFTIGRYLSIDSFDKRREHAADLVGPRDYHLRADAPLTPSIGPFEDFAPILDTFPPSPPPLDYRDCHKFFHPRQSVNFRIGGWKNRSLYE